LCHGPGFLRLRHVDLQRQPVHLPRHGGRGVEGDIDDDHPCALPGERQRIGAAEAQAPAGDDRNLVLETHAALPQRRIVQLPDRTMHRFRGLG
jgi:hypothetical protein